MFLTDISLSLPFYKKKSVKNELKVFHSVCERLY